MAQNNESFAAYFQRLDALWNDLTALMPTLDVLVVLQKAKLLSETYEEVTSTEIRSQIAEHFCQQGFPAVSTHWLKALMNMGIADVNVMETMTFLLRLHWRLTDVSKEYCQSCCFNEDFVKIIKHYVTYDLYPEGPEYAQPISNLVHAVLAPLGNICRHDDLCYHFTCEAVNKSLIRYSRNNSENLEISFVATLILCFIGDKNEESVLEELTPSFGRLMNAFRRALDNSLRIVYISEMPFRGRYSAEELSECLRVVTANEILGDYLIRHCGLLDTVQRYSDVKYASCMSDLTKILENLLQFPRNRQFVSENMDVEAFLNTLEENLLAWVEEIQSNINGCRDCLRRD